MASRILRKVTPQETKKETHEPYRIPPYIGENLANNAAAVRHVRELEWWAYENNSALHDCFSAILCDIADALDREAELLGYEKKGGAA